MSNTLRRENCDKRRDSRRKLLWDLDEYWNLRLCLHNFSNNHAESV